MDKDGKSNLEEVVSVDSEEDTTPKIKENVDNKEDITPKIGMEFDSKDEAFLYYNILAYNPCNARDNLILIHGGI